MKRGFALLLTAGLMLAACGGDTTQDPETKPIDPIGTWGMNLTWGTGDCGLTGTTPLSYLVSKNASGQFVIAVTQGTTVSGTFTCTATACDSSVTFTSAGTTAEGAAYSETDKYTLKLDASNKITGSGTATATGGLSCTQDATVTGTRT